jgi:hypothetical protein
MRSAAVLTFPDPVDEIAARLVAAGVVLLAAAALVLDARWLTIVLAYGFLARVLAGPRFSPLGLLVTRILVPRLPFEARPVPGPPKRFAQGIGATLTVTAAALTYGSDDWRSARVLLGVLVVAAGLEAAIGFCLGCKVFALLMRIGVVPAGVCERCTDLARA